MDEWTYIYKILFCSKKEGNSDIWNNMDEAGAHYAKWYKQDTEREIVHDVMNTLISLTVMIPSQCIHVL